MRNNPTEAESMLWKQLKNIKIKFRRQHILGEFIVDFISLEKGLIIEVDGDIHISQIEKDKERTDKLESQGYKVIRFRNEDIYKDIPNVIKSISEYCI